jgi:hypothetical protein
VAEIGQAGARHQPDIAATDHRDMHQVTPPLPLRRFLANAKACAYELASSMALCRAWINGELGQWLQQYSAVRLNHQPPYIHSRRLRYPENPYLSRMIDLPIPGLGFLALFC